MSVEFALSIVSVKIDFNKMFAYQPGSFEKKVTGMGIYGKLTLEFIKYIYIFVLLMLSHKYYKPNYVVVSSHSQSQTSWFPIQILTTIYVT